MNPQENEALRLLWDRSGHDRNTPVNTEGIHAEGLASLVERGLLIQQTDGTVRLTEEGIAVLTDEDRE